MVGILVRTGRISVRIILCLVILSALFFVFHVVKDVRAEASFSVDDANELSTSHETARALSTTRREILSRREANQRIWEVVRQVETRQPDTGEIAVEENVSRIVEVGMGICYKGDQGRWQITDASWRATDDGFTMDKAGYTLEIGSTLGTWLNYAVDGEVMRLRPNKVVAFDGEQTAILAVADGNVQGVIDAEDASRLFFADAFGSAIDLELQLLPSGFHQNVIFRSQPKIPAALNKAETKIHLFTELDISGYTEDVMIDFEGSGGQPRKVAELRDVETTAGDIRFLKESGKDPGASDRVFHRFVDSEVFDDGPAASRKRTVAGKSLVKEGGKRFLVETLDNSFLEDAVYPVVWDYSTEDTDLTADTIWYARNTYYISSNLTVDDCQLRIEPGTFVKFDSGIGLEVSGTGKIIARGNPYLPIVFTSVNDDDNGETITGESSGSPFYGDYDGLHVDEGSQIEFCSFYYADRAIEVKGELDLPIQHNYFYAVVWAVHVNNNVLEAGESLTIFNNLMVVGPVEYEHFHFDLPTGIEIYGNSASANIYIRNNTIHLANGGLVLNNPDGPSITVENNIFTSCQTGILGEVQRDYDYLTCDYNGYYDNSTADFDVTGKSIGGNAVDDLSESPYYDSFGSNFCAFYLNDEEDGGAKFFDEGNGTPSEAGYTDPKAWSIEHLGVNYYNDSRVFASTSILSSDTIWDPEYGTCDADSIVDLGYHHPRVDYFIHAGTVTVDGSGITLTIEPGTVVVQKVNSSTGAGKLVIDGTDGPDTGDKLVCVGDPFGDGYITWVDFYRARHDAYNGVLFSNTKKFIEFESGSDYDVRFTKFYGLGMALVPSDGGGTIQDCVFLLNAHAVDYRSCTDYVCRNCLFMGNNMALRDSLGDHGLVENCTFDRNTRGISFAVASGSDMLARNNLFTSNGTGIFLSNNGTLTEEYNGYYNNGSGPSDNVYDNAPGATIYSSNQVLLAADPYETAWIDFADRFCLDQDCDLIDAGNDVYKEGMRMYTTSLNGREDKYVEDAQQQMVEKLDIGYHYRGIGAYSTSFESYQDYSDWDGFTAKVHTYYDDPENDETYVAINYRSAYFESYETGTISRSFDNAEGRNRFIRFNCIPVAGSYFHIKDGSDTVASVWFKDPGDPEPYPKTIYVWDEDQEDYVDTTKVYEQASGNSILETCRSYLTEDLSGGGRAPRGYSYERAWMDFEIQVDWTDRTYDVMWRRAGPGQLWESIITQVPLGGNDVKFSKVEIAKPDTTTNELYVNRVSVFTDDHWSANDEDSDTPEASVVPPEASREAPLIGANPIDGNIWHHQLGRYVVKCCPTDAVDYDLEDYPDASPWLTIAPGDRIVQYDTQAIWDTFQFRNGDYYLKVEIYDDLNRLIETLDNDGIVQREIHYYDSTPTDLGGAIDAEFPIIGIGKGKTYHYEEKPDITVNWPGSFPFEFKRTYDDNLKSNLYPLFFGWTHNHNIRIIENCRMDWEEYDDNGTIRPVKDPAGLGIGRIWLSQALGSRMFKYDSVESDYRPVDNERDYIERTSTKDGNDYDVSYTYHAPDGRIFTFDETTITPGPQPNGYTPHANAGAVDWQIVKGIDEQKDRFGNALIYSYNNDITDPDRTGEAELYIMEIANNRTPAKLLFEDDFQPFGAEGPRLYSKVQMKAGSVGCDVIDFSCVVGPLVEDNTRLMFDYTYKKLISETGAFYGSFFQWQYEQKDSGFELLSIYQPDLTCEMEDSFWSISQQNPTFESLFISRADDGALETITEIDWDNYTIGGIWYYEDYSYVYDASSAQLTTNIIHQVQCDSLFTIKSEEVVTNAIGSIVSQKTTTYPAYPTTDSDQYGPSHANQYFNPSLYYDTFYWDYYEYLADFAYYEGGGGATDTEFLYADADFPHKPTTILEYIDVDAGGDGVFESQSTRKTTYAYDDDGNLIEQRRYINDTDYVLTQYVYHDTYNFPIKQTTWKDYQTGVTTPTTPVGERVEKLWKYGDYDGGLVSGGSDGAYLVKEETLIAENSEVWTTTSYEYYEFDDSDGLDDGDGLLRIKTDPESNKNYYTYDDNGLPRKEWHGATFTAGLPDGDPQKRYFYNDFGYKALEGDYLGKVTAYLNDYDLNSDPYVEPYESPSRVKETRVYSDLQVMEKSDAEFVTDTYLLLQEGSSTLYQFYNHYDKPTETLLPDYDESPSVSGRIRKYTDVDFTLKISYSDSNPYNDVEISSRRDGTPMLISRWTENHTELFTTFIHDSLNRTVHKYEYNYHYHSTQYPDTDCLYPAITHTQYGYYGTGQKRYEKVYKVIRTEDQGNPVFTPTLEKYTKYFYDELDRLIEQVEDANDVTCLNITVKFGYDAVGNRIYVVDPEDNVIFTDYDNANRKIAEYFAEPAVYISGTDIVDVQTMTDPQNPLITPKKQVEYYDNDKVKKVTSYDYNGSTILACSEYTYDSRGRVSHVREYIEDDGDNVMEDDQDTSAVTAYGYSDGGFQKADDQLPDYDPDVPDDYASFKYHIKITDAEGKKTWISLHPLAKPQKIVYPSGDYEEIEYYGFGLPSSKTVWDTDGDDLAILYDYDEFGKLSEVAYPDDVDTTEVDESGTLEYEYTARTLGKYGKVKKITDDRATADNPGGEDSTYEFDYYDWSGRLLSYTDYEGFTTTYDYNAAWNRKTQIEVANPSDEVIYKVGYFYNLAGRLETVTDANSLDPHYIAGFDYDDNGNRTALDYYLDETLEGNTYGMDYTHNADNFLTGISTDSTTSSAPVFIFDADDSGDIDGLGRLTNADETLYPDTATISHTFDYTYDLMSQLASGKATDIDGLDWIREDFVYNKDGNVTNCNVVGSDSSVAETDYSYTNSGDSDIMASATGDGAFTLSSDLNGNTTKLPTSSANDTIEYNWDNKLRSASKGSDSITVKYDPMGNRVYKSSYDGSSTTVQKFIVDIAGKLPTIIGEYTDPNSFTNSYIYADAHILAQHDHVADDTYYYVHDRLGSVRLVAGYNGSDTVSAKNTYTYSPFGNPYAGEVSETVYNPFQFTGQWYDEEIDQYYLRARMYDPTMMRFTTRDPARGSMEEPRTLHKYLYCWNNPVNLIDLNGQFPGSLTEMTVKMAVWGGLVGGMGGFLQAAIAVSGGAADSVLEVCEIFTKSIIAGSVGGALAGYTFSKTMSLEKTLLVGAAGGGIAAGITDVIWNLAFERAEEEEDVKVSNLGKTLIRSDYRQMGLLYLAEEIDDW